MTETTPLMRKNELVIQELSNELLIYDLKTNKTFGLNETAALVWLLSTGDKTISEIAETVAQKLNTPVSEELVWLALGQLKKEQLLENGIEISSHYQGKTRREVIKKVGLASLVALPVISSFVAPMAVHAQSSNCAAPPLANGCVCTTQVNCASNCCRFPLGGSGTCVPSATVGTGGVCLRSCECITMCCGGVVCATTGKSSGAPCAASCECASLSCSGPGSTCL